jgi:glycosyltransferase involved in cell wall biosynthesis
MVATAVGGIGEIFGPDAGALVPPGDAGALAHAIENQARVRASFSVDAMTEAVLAAYGEVLAQTRGLTNR